MAANSTFMPSPNDTIFWSVTLPSFNQRVLSILNLSSFKGV